MIHTVRIIVLSVALVLTISIGESVLAENDFPISEISAGNFFGIGARGVSMGGAQIAAGMDGTALVYNPALLARIRRIEVLAGMSHERLSNDENSYPLTVVPDYAYDGTSKSFTRLNALNVTVPVPTYRGSAVVGFGVNRVSSFDHVFSFGQSYSDPGGIVVERGSELETGGLYMYSAGGAMDLSPRVSVGASLNLYHGKDSYSWYYFRDGDPPMPPYMYEEYITADYVGVSAKVGLVASLNPQLSVGAVVESPVSFEIDGEYSSGQYYTYEYSLNHPFSFGAGIAYSVNRLQLALDMHYTDWTQLEYADDPDMVVKNRYFDLYYREAMRLHAGAEYMLPSMGAKIRAGYTYDPIPYADFLVKDDREYVTLGIGFLIDRMMTLDIAYVGGSYEYALPNTSVAPTGGLSADARFEKYSVNRIYVTTAFRL